MCGFRLGWSDTYQGSESCHENRIHDSCRCHAGWKPSGCAWLCVPQHIPVCCAQQRSLLSPESLRLRLSCGGCCVPCRKNSRIDVSMSMGLQQNFWSGGCEELRPKFPSLRGNLRSLLSIVRSKRLHRYL